MVWRKKLLAWSSFTRSKNDDRIIIKPIRITSQPPTRIRKWNQFCQVRRKSANVILIAKDLKLVTFRWRAKSSKNAASKRSAFLHIFFCSLSNISKYQLIRLDMKTVFHARPYGRSKETISNRRRMKLHRIN